MNVQIKPETVTVPSFKELRTSVNWPLPEDRVIEKSLDNTTFCVTAYADDHLAGMGRIVGDNSFIFFIADIIIKPEYQKKGIGARIMEEIMSWLNANAPEHSYIILTAARGQEEFYEKFGFFRRPNAQYGHGMMFELTQ